MFLCEPCHKAAFGEGGHLSGSRGPCESCGKVADCADCHCRVAERPHRFAPSPTDGTPPFLHKGTRRILVQRRDIASHGYPPHHHIWKALLDRPTAILTAYAGVTGNTPIWVIPGEGGYRYYILSDHAKEILPDKKGEFGT